MTDAAYKQHLDVVILPEVYKYRIIKDKKTCLTSRKIFIKVTKQQKNDTYKNMFLQNIYSTKVFTKIARCVHLLSLGKVVIFRVLIDKLFYIFSQVSFASWLL